MEFPPEKPTLTPPPTLVERRGDARTRCKGTCEIYILPDGPRIKGSMLNLSVGGCCFESESESKVALQTTVEVRIDAYDLRLRLAGEVRRVEENKFFGIHFVEVGQRKLEQIQTLITEAQELEKVRNKACNAQQKEEAKYDC